MKSKYFLPTVLLVVGLAAGFAGGYFFKTFNQQRQFSQIRNGNTMGQRFVPNGGQPSGQNRGMMFGGATEGEVISMDDKAITVKLSDGSTKIVLFSDSTAYSNVETSKKTDLKQGLKVSVFGKTNTDGSLTADRIQLNSAK